MPMTTSWMSHLLLSSADVPSGVKTALRAAADAGTVEASLAWRRRAAFLLESEFGLDPRDSFALVDLEAGPHQSLAA